MKIEIKLECGKTIFADSNYLTVKARKQIVKKFDRPAVEITEDKIILAELAEKFKTTPPTEQEIFEGYLSIAKNHEKDGKEEELEPYFEELTRVCCRWKDEAGTLTEVTEDDFQNLPFDAANYISNNLFTNEEKSFLVVPQASV